MHLKTCCIDVDSNMSITTILILLWLIICRNFPKSGGKCMNAGLSSRQVGLYYTTIKSSYFPPACLIHSSATSFLSTTVRLKLSPVVPHTMNN